MAILGWLENLGRKPDDRKKQAPTEAVIPKKTPAEADKWARQKQAQARVRFQDKN
jgi:hypothetical protein